MGQTATPWSIVDDLVVRSSDGSNVSGLVVKRMRPDDAAFIVRAVNCHADLLAACEWIMKELCEAWDETEEKAIPEKYRAALATAKGAL